MKIPKKIKDVLRELEKNGFQGFLVGGCVRDLLREVEPKDWDVTTNATPVEIQKVFPDNFYENDFGTVTVLGDVEITPFRTEAKYTDKRHPDKGECATTIDEDLSRRDFTVNALALDSKLKLKMDLDRLEREIEDIEKEILKRTKSLEDISKKGRLRKLKGKDSVNYIG